ncbi:MAG: hypothetical protein FWG87_07050 [Defluviitaleaceae bacterium]|nr:hypothetical protein [Defluviitaleaceae bacterium]
MRGGIVIYSYANSVIVTFGVSIATFYIFARAVNHKITVVNAVLSIAWCLAFAFSYTTVSPLFLSSSLGLLYLIISILAIMKLTKMKPDIVISAFLLSFGISYILYFIARGIAMLPFAPFIFKDYNSGDFIDYDTPIFFLLYLLSSTLHLLLAYTLFRIRRFKRGFPFLLKGSAVIIALSAVVAVMVLASWGRALVESDYVWVASIALLGLFVTGLGIFIWVKKGITRAYLRWAKDNNNEIYQQAIEEKDAEIRRLSELSGVLRMENHSINHRLAALERGYTNILQQLADGVLTAELAATAAASLEDVQRTALDYSEGVKKARRENRLPSTNNKMLDDLFNLFAERCSENKIDFDLIVTGSIQYLIENIIPQSKLETLIGDHLQDAIIAVNASTRPFRNILVTLGIAGDFYALTIFDSGIPFEADTLIQLGTGLVTTYAEKGGSGVGFMKTFETKRECGASLIIAERQTSDEAHTKSVTMRFDGKNRYIIETYRPHEFPSSDRYIVTSLNSLNLT